MNKELLLELQDYLAKYDTFEEATFCLMEADEVFSFKKAQSDALSSSAISTLIDYIDTKRKPSFRNVLFAMIDERGLTDPEVYKRALIDRRLFAKIRANANYQPSKPTVIALALALKLSLEETETLLSAAGYSLSDCDTFDLIIRFYLEKTIYDIDEVNQALEYFSIRPLGS